MHSYCALPSEDNLSWILAVTDYGPQRYISMVQKGNVVGTQFHPEKSGQVGLKILSNFLEKFVSKVVTTSIPPPPPLSLQDVYNKTLYTPTQLSKRIIACLDVRSNDDGDLVVTKGDQYDVRENTGNGAATGRYTSILIDNIFEFVDRLQFILLFCILLCCAEVRCVI